MAQILPFQNILKNHLHLEPSRREQSLWAFFLLFCLSATIGLALCFEYIGGYLPCDLCLIERFPYYGALPFLLLAGFGAWFFRISSWVQLLFLCVFVLMTISLVLAVYHAGVEYGFWKAPPSCGVSVVRRTTDVNQLFAGLNNIHPPSCSEAPTHFLFLSFAGWNVVASLFYMLISLYVSSKGLLSTSKKP
ncbi:disulfide bond formation protein DsbB [Bartonella callosciuri]|uniref:Disulfide bond formation protein DsbB n=1 Tax=Bartonella callosciuri TaxID=686223 RepID=A0A840P2D9_9HYPH|nr:disulfide bond formation protein B [Bartonella callosciuri]MBB5074447.1 disulfide bond formation protein DsbB [Bartonella callosciuri]